MTQPLMPKATAIWLIENTILTFTQIAEFSGLHELEIQALADGDVSAGMSGSNPIVHGELTQDEIKRCEADPNAQLRMSQNNLPKPKIRSKGPKYTPISKRGDKPDAIAYILKHHSVVTDAQIVKLVGTTKNTINSVRDRTHANSANITPKDPVTLGLCSQTEMNAAIERAEKKAAKAAPAAVSPMPEPSETPSAEAEALAPQDPVVEIPVVDTPSEEQDVLSNEGDGTDETLTPDVLSEAPEAPEASEEAEVASS